MLIRIFLFVFAVLLPSISCSETSNGYSAFGNYRIGYDSGDIRNVYIFKTPQKSQVNPKDKIGTITFDQSGAEKSLPITFSKEIPSNYQLLLTDPQLFEAGIHLQVFSNNSKGNNDGWIKIGFVINNNEHSPDYYHDPIKIDNNSIIYAWIKMQEGDKLTAYKDFYKERTISKEEQGLLVKFFTANINNKKPNDLSSENKKVIDELINDSCWCFYINAPTDVYEYASNNLSRSGKRKKITSISSLKEEQLSFDIIKTEGDKALIIFLDKEHRLIIGWINIFDNKHRYIIFEYAEGDDL